MDAVKLVMTSILSTQPWIRDPAVISMPWNSDMEKSTLARALPDRLANEKLPLKLGVFWTDGVVGPQPPIKRGLHMVHDVLKSMGHKVKLILVLSILREIEWLISFLFRFLTGIPLHKIMLNEFTYVLLSIVDALYNKSDPF